VEIRKILFSEISMSYKWRTLIGGALLVWIPYLAKENLTATMGPSMHPTFNMIGDIVQTERIADYDSLRRGDLVQSRSPDRAGDVIIKRVAGLPGSVVQDPLSAKNRTIVPHGTVWLLGDNPKASIDSRHYGPVPLAMIERRVVRRVWPLDQFGPLPCAPAHI
jgi:mitochondrial inner membrane protease subunit 1